MNNQENAQIKISANTSCYSLKLIPDYPTIHPWESYSANLMQEYKQLFEEGFDVAPLKGLYESIAQMPAGATKERLCDTLFKMISELKLREDYEFIEPSDLASIKADTSAFDLSRLEYPNKDILTQKVLGGWYGRVCGCLLGKPVEGFKSDELKKLLTACGNYPLNHYILRSEATDEVLKELGFTLPNCLADEIDAAPVDDDTNYTVLASQLIEKSGKDFTSADVADLWMSSQPKTAYCTAERIAFVNFCNGFLPPYSAVYKNTFREWIGAQIRGDYFGFINPCNPEKAAEMAWRDASISHIKNGIYGEMFVSAMISAAYGTDCIKTIIECGLSVIPHHSRLFKAIENVLEIYNSGKTSDECLNYIHSQFDEYDIHDWCHTISNAMVVSACLLYGKGNFGNSICMSVQTGFDTDCNGATVGAILGIRNGISGIDNKWTAPIKGKLNVSICNSSQFKITDLVDITLKHIGD